MDEEKLAVILGALLHDIGKFMQRAETPLSEQSKGMESSICPVYQGQYSHKHVLWTNEFFEQYFQAELIGISTVDIGNLACYHHIPDIALQGENGTSMLLCVSIINQLKSIFFSYLFTPSRRTTNRWLAHV